MLKKKAVKVAEIFFSCLFIVNNFGPELKMFIFSSQFAQNHVYILRVCRIIQWAVLIFQPDLALRCTQTSSC